MNFRIHPCTRTILLCSLRHQHVLFLPPGSCRMPEFAQNSDLWSHSLQGFLSNKLIPPRAASEIKSWYCSKSKSQTGILARIFLSVPQSWSPPLPRLPPSLYGASPSVVSVCSLTPYCNTEALCRLTPVSKLILLRDDHRMPDPGRLHCNLFQTFPSQPCCPESTPTA